MNNPDFNLELFIATGNPGKRAELAALLAARGLKVAEPAGVVYHPPLETASTFVENALLKARAACRATGLAALADDSGLVVPSLGGAPGIVSSRFAGAEGDHQANIRRLLALLDGLAPGRRRAYFYCVLVVLRTAEDPAPLIAEGRWDGEIATAPSGTGGFGYDPVFRPAGDTRTAAELGGDEKNRHSHRARAIAQLLGKLGGD